MMLTRDHKLLAVLCVIFFIAGILRLNDLSLYTDSTRYLIWGTSIAQLKGFVDDTGPEPDRYVVNAPLYAVLISPTLIFFPLSVLAAKVWTLLWGVCAIVVFYLWLSRAIGSRPALLSTFVFAVNPFMLVLSTEVLSESPFLVLVFLVMMLADTLLGSTNTSRIETFLLLSCTTVVVLLREVGITMIGAIFFAFLAKKRAKHAFLVVTCAAALYTIWLVRNLVLVGETPAAQSSNINFIFQHFLTSPTAPFYEEIAERVQSNVAGFGFQIAGMLFYPLPPDLIIDPGDTFRTIVNNLSWGKYFIIGLAISFIVIGVLMDFKKSSSALIRFLFQVMYLGVILTYPIHDIRFLLPVLPFMIFYSARTFSWFGERLQRITGQPATFVGVVLILIAMTPNIFCNVEILKTNISYQDSPLEFHRRTSSSNPDKTYFSLPWSIAGTWIRENTPERTVIASSAKELVPFIGNRKLLEINNGVPLPIFEFLLRDYGAQYILANGLWSDFTSYEFLMQESSRFWFEPVFQAANLHLYKVHSRYRFKTTMSRRPVEDDTVSATGLLRDGRSELMSENYDRAIRALERTARLQPRQPEPLFQLFLAYAFKGDSSKALEIIQTMFRKARSTPYVWAAQLHVTAMDHLRQSQAAQSLSQRSTQLFDVARLYWTLGFRLQAYRLMREAVTVDPSYFVGLLWAWHYGIQVDDTAGARSYLRTLERIDRSNAVVTSFRTMTTYADSLRRAATPPQRSHLRLIIARLYDKVELPEEAIDETERAVGEDSRNAKAWQFLAELFDKKKKPRQAREAALRVLELEPDNQFAKSRLTQED